MKNKLLRQIPPVDEILKDPKVREAGSGVSAILVTDAIRAVLDQVRLRVLSGKILEISRDLIVNLCAISISDLKRPSLRKIINASGTILHTNIGRAALPKAAQIALQAASQGNVNLEYDLDRAGRSERDDLVTPAILRLTGAEAACVVNNNAAAVLIVLNTLAEGKEVVVSRGELIEIGGSFRLPDIIRKSNCRMIEVGTTNRTHPADFEGAINPSTGLLFKAHTSNYKVVGFTSSVELKALSAIGRRFNVPVVEDLGSGSLVDLETFGFAGEPTVRQSIEAGADIVTFSGDKLLGGPQAGIIAGRKDLIDRIKKNPLKRALRVDKLILSALEATLLLYNDLEGLKDNLPTLRHLTRNIDEINDLAKKSAGLLRERLGKGYSIEVVDELSEVGAGSLPGREIASKAVKITHSTISANEIFRMFLSADPAILGRVNKDRFLLDMRCIESAQDVVPNRLPKTSQGSYDSL